MRIFEKEVSGLKEKQHSLTHFRLPGISQVPDIQPGLSLRGRFSGSSPALFTSRSGAAWFLLCFPRTLFPFTRFSPNADGLWCPSVCRWPTLAAGIYLLIGFSVQGHRKLALTSPGELKRKDL